MALSEAVDQINYEEFLCVDNKGWNINLFTNQNNTELYLCKLCGNVCRDASKLGCDHGQELIDSYCHKCLDVLIKSNQHLCPVNQHSHPIIQSMRTRRTQILKSQVRCPNATDSMDEKGGNINVTPNKLATKCTWAGTLNDLITIHFKQCKYNDNDNDKFKINALTNQLLSIQNICNQQNKVIQVLHSDNNGNRNDIIELKKQIFALNATMNGLGHMMVQNEQKTSKQVSDLNQTLNGQAMLIKTMSETIIEQNKKITKLERMVAEKEEKESKENESGPSKIAYNGIFTQDNVSKYFAITHKYQITSSRSASKAAKLDKALPVNPYSNDIYYWKILANRKGDCSNCMIGVVSDKCVNFETDCNTGLVDCFGICACKSIVAKGKRTDKQYGDYFRSGDTIYIEYNCKLSKLTFSRYNTQYDMKRLYEINLPTTAGVRQWFPAICAYYADETFEFVP